MTVGIELGEALLDLPFQLAVVDPLTEDRVARGIRVQIIPIGGIVAGTGGEDMEVGGGGVAQDLQGIRVPGLILVGVDLQGRPQVVGVLQAVGVVGPHPAEQEAGQEQRGQEAEEDQDGQELDDGEAPGSAHLHDRTLRKKG